VKLIQMYENSEVKFVEMHEKCKVKLIWQPGSKIKLPVEIMTLPIK
jgi:hypothetical protein